MGLNAQETATDTDGWPEVLRAVAEECGVGVALALAGAFGGRELYVPRPENIGEDHPLAIALGLAAARLAAAALGAGSLMIPLGPASTFHRRLAAMRRLRREGKSNGEAARLLGVHRRTVELRHQRDRERGEGEIAGQPRLFED
jgi:hypothetical protein